MIAVSLHSPWDLLLFCYMLNHDSFDVQQLILCIQKLTKHDGPTYMEFSGQKDIFVGHETTVHSSLPFHYALNNESLSRSLFLIFSYGNERQTYGPQF